MWTHSPPHPARGTSVSYIWIVWFKLPFCHGFNKYLLSSAISLGSPNTHSCSTSSRFCSSLPRILLLCLANPSGSVKVMFFFLWNYTLLLLEQQPAPTPPISHFSVIVGDICFMYSEDVYWVHTNLWLLCISNGIDLLSWRSVSFCLRILCTLRPILSDIIWPHQVYNAYCFVCMADLFSILLSSTCVFKVFLIDSISGRREWGGRLRLWENLNLPWISLKH